MNILGKIFILLSGLAVALPCHCSEFPDNKSFFLFTDRNSCISGDSVWFKVVLPDNQKIVSNIIHVQMSSPDGRLIASVMKKNNKGIAEGYLPTDDSLQTGIYTLKAFVAPVVNENSAQSYLFVYNRFEKEISQFSVPVNEEIYPYLDYSKHIRIETDRLIYKCGDSINVNINISGNLNDSVLIVGARLADPLADRFSGFRFIDAGKIDSADINIPSEVDGFYVCGKVRTIHSMEPVQGALVLLSIQGQNPWFDYFVTDKSGHFTFFLKGANGTGNLILQAYSQDNRALSVELSANSYSDSDKPGVINRSLTKQEIEFLEESIQTDYFRRLYGTDYHPVSDFFSIPQQYSIPFFGNPDFVVKLSDFIELSDFAEISRELLMGVRYRIKDNKPVIRVVNTRMNDIFDEEPLKLINGVPVFDNNLISGLKSTDIETITCLLRERIFGDLVFKGVLSIKLKENDDEFLDKIPDIRQFRIRCLQPDKIPGYLMKTPGLPENIPDLRPVFFWSVVKTRKNASFSFRASDIGGDYFITVRGVTSGNMPFKAEKKIKVE